MAESEDYHEKICSKRMELSTEIVGRIGHPGGRRSGGWIVAGLVRALLKKSSLDNRIVSWATGGQLSQPGYSEKLISRIVFWVLIAFVLAGVFQALRLPVITDPLVGMLRPIFG